MEKKKSIFKLAMISDQARDQALKQCATKSEIQIWDSSVVLMSWADQELQPQSQGPAVIYTGPLEAW